MKQLLLLIKFPPVTEMHSSGIYWGTSDEASAARIFFISDTHSDATCTEVYTATLVHYKKFHRHVRSIHLIERFQGDKQTGAQSGLVYTVGIGMRKEAANKDLATTISWAHDPFKEVWVCHRSALTSNVMKGIVRLPHSHKRIHVPEIQPRRN